MERADLYTAQFDVLSEDGRHRFSLGVELRERNPDGTIPRTAEYDTHLYELDTEDDGGITIYVRSR
jgi:hypothetical protein